MLRSTRRNLAAVTFGVVVTAGCGALAVKVMGHNRAGLSRTVAVERLPTVECTTRALKAIEHVAVVRSYSVAKSESWSLLEGREEYPGYDVIVYERGDSGGQVLLFSGAGSRSPRIELASTTYAPGHPETQYPPERLDRIRRTLDVVYAELSARCGPLPEPSAVVETNHQTGAK